MAECHRALSSVPNFEPPLRGSGGYERMRKSAASPRAVPCRAEASRSRRPVRTEPVRPAPAAGHAYSDARRFAERSLRIVLEVLDHRRPVGQLAAVAQPSVVAAMRTLVSGDLVPARGLGVAVLARVDVVMVDAATAEICARYQRGSRHLALAARIVCTPAHGWRLTVLRVR
ncbi:Rv3235 family protein [Nocardia sp. NPDC050710]|uniref:Rv3235 family protein n=1 Tax=Nocardia sp. NPDC050710 TaxID=3157220 RepID=UPI0033D3C67C